MTRLGMTLGLGGGALHDEVELCAAAEELGYTDVWSAEVGGADGLSPLAAAALVTERMRLGTAILPVYTRPPALLAMSAATLQDLSGGRFVLGLGTSSSIIVESWMGARFEHPLARVRDYVDVIRAALAGEKVSHAELSMKGFRLQHPVADPPPIYIAALGPAMCRLAGEVADGVIFFLKSPHGVEQAMGWVNEGATRAGRDASQLDVVIRLPVFVDADSDVEAKKMVVMYGMVDVYNRSLVAQGFEDEAKAIATAWGAGDRAGAVGAVSDRMANELAAIGDADACKQRVEEFRSAGVTTPVLLPVAPRDPVEALRALAPSPG